MCIDRFGIKDFRFYDDAITFPRWDLKRFCEAIIDRKLKLSWNCWSRVNDVDEEKLRLMKAAGCYHIKFGVEFGTEKALRLARNFDPIPGSPFYQRIIRGEIDPKHDMLSRETTMDLAYKAYRAFYLRPIFIFQRLKSFLLHPKQESYMLLNGALMVASFWFKKWKKSFHSIFKKGGENCG